MDAPLREPEPILTVEEIAGPVGDVLNERVYINDPGQLEAVTEDLKKWTIEEYQEVLDLLGIPQVRRYYERARLLDYLQQYQRPHLLPENQALLDDIVQNPDRYDFVKKDFQRIYGIFNTESLENLHNYFRKIPGFKYRPQMTSSDLFHALHEYVIKQAQIRKAEREAQDPYNIVNKFIATVPILRRERAGPLAEDIYEFIYENVEQLSDEQLKKIVGDLGEIKNPTQELALTIISNYLNNIHYGNYLGYGLDTAQTLSDRSREILDEVIDDPLVMWRGDAGKVQQILSRVNENQLRNYLNSLFNDYNPELDTMNRNQLVNYFHQTVINRYHQFSNTIRNYIRNELRNRRPLEFNEPEANTQYLTSADIRRILDAFAIDYPKDADKWQLVNYLTALSDEFRPIEQQTRLIGTFRRSHED